MSSYLQGYAGPPKSKAKPAILTFGWADDLTALPALTLDTTLSTGINQAQLAAGLSLNSGALQCDLNAMLAAGASAAAVGIAWLDDCPRFQGPAQVYADAAMPTATGSGTNNGAAGFAVYYYADALPATTPTPPPGAPSAPGGLRLSCAYGLGVSGARSVVREEWTTAVTTTTNDNFVAGVLDLLPYTNNRTGITRRGAAYPPTGSTTGFTDARNFNAAPFAADHRLRLALIVRLTGSASLPTVTLRRLAARFLAAG
jgi:hypothetical protein